ncbi:tRNA 2-selenouridine synthase [Chromobacterium alkanivorans]|nr:tRNA 2-selenouridine synthase [Chromobacterium alkanivorans]MCS3818225.1 tRNA 2-selenouridine synthase [Chromobacterium alkanivorans]MCS3874576.1 tRNA 2-selenouridine synthase [Chromobacterium alkanivorans]
MSPFEARKVGAALAAKNIARHIEESFSDRPKSWRPLICCWRGGQRSGSMALIFAQIGWPAHQLEGGYKAYRRQALQWLEELPGQLRLRVICGPTGSGKSRLLQALARAGHQVLDLEQLANHRGSVLGRLPDQPQPPQKWFDTLLLQQIRGLDPNRPVFIEAESKKVGFVSLPDALYRQMHQGDCLLIDVPLAERVRFLLEDYAFYLQDPEALIRQLGFLKGLHSGEQLDAWNQMIRAGRFDALVAELLAKHYDPLYYRSLGKHYPQLAEAMPLRLDSLAPERLDLAAAQIA